MDERRQAWYAESDENEFSKLKVPRKTSNAVAYAKAVGTSAAPVADVMFKTQAAAAKQRLVAFEQAHPDLDMLTPVEQSDYNRLKQIAKAADTANMARQAAKGAINIHNEVQRNQAAPVAGGLDQGHTGGADFYSYAAGLYSGVTGGDENGEPMLFFGGDEVDMGVIREYAGTLNSFTKQRLITDIVEAMDSLGIKAEGNTLDEKLQSVIKSIPNSKRNGKNFKQSAESHSRVCKRLASAINDSFGTVVINPNEAPEVVCQSVSEIVQSLSTSMHAEFLAVHSNITRILKNLHLLREQMRRVHDPLIAGLKESSDKKLSNKSIKHSALYTALATELDRQIAMLEHLLSVTISPAESKLKNLLEHVDEGAFVEEISSKVGDSQFGDLISKVLTGLGVTAEYAMLIDRALKTVGVSVDEYANSPSLRTVASKISETLMNSDFDDEAAHKFLMAAELLYKNYYRSKDIQKLLSKSGSDEKMFSRNDNATGGSESFFDVYNTFGGDESEDETAAVGGVDYSDESNYRRSKLDKRIETKHAIRSMVFKTFSAAVDEHMSKIIHALNVLTNKIGTGIRLSDELDGFRGSLSRLRPLLIKKNAYLALIGYYNDAMSRERREVFLGQLSLIKSYADTLATMPMYSSIGSSFSDVSAAIGGLKETVDKYSDKIAAKFGGEDGDSDSESGEDPLAAHDVEDGPEPAGPSCDDKCLSLEGLGVTSDAVEETIGGAMPLSTEHLFRGIKEKYSNPKQNIIRKAPRTLNEVITKFDYYYRVSQIKLNLANAGDELDHYAENYETIRAESIAKKIDDIESTCTTKLAALADTPATPLAPNALAAHNWLKTLAIANEDDAAEKRAAAYQAVKEVARVKANFWRTVEALDEYMRVFTNDLVKNHSALDDIKTMLDETEVIHDWYSDNTGTLIHKLFDSFPASVDGANKAVKVDDKWINASPHYYEGAEATAASPFSLPGDVNIPVLPDSIDYGFTGFTKMRSVTRNLHLLKNILSVFIRIGSKFGNYKKVFMTPTQVFKNLSEWIEVCSFRVGGSTTVVGGSAGEQAFMSEYGIDMRNTDKAGEEDKMFACMIKSMCAKVLTVVGLFDLFERPDEALSYNSVRMTLGGGNEMPEINPRAVELYIRLPLLAEFYRKLFDFNGDNGDNFIKHDERTSRAEKIAMLPEVEGPFSGLIKLVFKKAREFSITEYSDVELYELIREVNLIYSRLSGAGGDDVSGYVIKQFVREVNMRYGIINERDRNLYVKEFGHHLNYSSVGVDNDGRDFDLALLPGEEDIEFERDAVAPSKKYETASQPGAINAKGKKSPHFIVKSHRTMLNRLRCALDSYFRENNGTGPVYGATYGDPGDKSYGVNKSRIEKNSLRPAIKSASIKLRGEQNKENQYKLVAGLIRGSSLLTKTDHVKHLMFHETVVSGLNVMSMIYTMLRRYQMLVLGTDLKTMIGTDMVAATLREKLCVKYVGDPAAAGGNPFDEALKDAYVKLAAVGTKLDDDNIKTHLNLHTIAADLVEGVYAISEDMQDLVDVRVTEDSIMVNFGDLKVVAMSMLNNISKFIDSMRPHVSEHMIERYVAKTRPGSLYWLQEQLVDKLFEGRDAGEDFEGNGVHSNHIAYVNLDGLNRVLNSTMKILRKNDDGTAANNTFNWGQLLARFTFYDSQLTNSGLAGINVVNEAYKYGGAVDNAAPALGIDYSLPMNKLLMKNEGAKQVVYPRVSNRFHQLYSWNNTGYSNNSSLLFSFNQLLAKYLNVCYDASAEKIYINTFSNLVNSSLNNSIMNTANTFPDYIPGGTRVEVQAGKGGVANADSIAAYAAIEAGGGTMNQLRSAVNSVLKMNGKPDIPGVVDVPALNVAIAAAGVAMPTFLQTLIAQVEAGTAPARTKSLAKMLFESHNKSTGSFFMSNNAKVGGDLPVPIGTTDSMSNNTNKQFGNLKDPASDNVLFTSLALILQNLIGSVNAANGKPVYLLENIAEVSGFKKEALRAHLPAFRALFKALQTKCEYIKKIASMNGVTGHRVNYAAPAAWIATVAREGLSTTGDEISNAGDHTDTIRNFQAIASSISHACGATLVCIDAVLRELADSPKFLETHAGSIAEYKSIYGCDPLMPMSSALFVFKNNTNAVEYTDALPFSTVGSNTFKLSYGIRGLLNSQHAKFSPSDVPGYAGVLDLFNAIVPAKEQLDAKTTSEFLMNFVKLTRWLHSIRNHKAYLTPIVADKYDDVAPASMHAGAISRTMFIDSSGAAAAAIRNNRTTYGIISDNFTSNVVSNTPSNNVAVMALSLSNNRLLDIAMNGDREAKIEEFAIHMSGKPGVRGDITVANIIDLNIMPINIHAMMRDIPLTNLYNYAYTFDRLIISEMYGIDDDTANLLMWKLAGSGDCTTAPGDISSDTSARELFVSLLMKPYATDLTGANRTTFDDMCRGDDNLPLGRPKFMSDQLLNKVLFGELYPNGGNSWNDRRGTPKAPGVPKDLSYHKSTRGREHAAEALPKTSALKTVTVAVAGRVSLDAVGQQRLDTVFTRNLVLMTNAYRALLHRLRNDLTYNKSVVVSSNAITREDNTEFIIDQRVKSRRSDEYDPNYGSKL